MLRYDYEDKVLTLKIIAVSVKVQCYSTSFVLLLEAERQGLADALRVLLSSQPCLCLLLSVFCDDDKELNANEEEQLEEDCIVTLSRFLLLKLFRGLLDLCLAASSFVKSCALSIIEGLDAGRVGS